MITLTLKEQPGVPIEAEALSPDVVAKLGNDEIRALPIFLGKRQLSIEEFFEVEGEASEELEIHGDAGRIKWLGRGMTRGRLKIVGNAGMHLGAFMKGGTIDVSGNASDWIGAEMSGGLIRIGGNAGGQIGAAYRGSLTGMTDGTIVVEGSAGLEVGMRMKRGTIVIKGSAKDFTGLEMKGGTIILGGAELRTGAWMNRGTIISLTPIPLLPTFAYNCSYNPTFLRVYSRELATLGVSVPFEESEGSYELYSGDAAVSRKGELLIWQPAG
jgi:formylmethanofuran dehydrogenase subunit C